MNNDFLSEMKEMLQSEFSSYLDTLSVPAFRGFRVNTLKISKEEFLHHYSIPCHNSPFAMDSFILDTDETYGNSLMHRQGLMYMQEPSASCVVPVLDPHPGDIILDMCAAPGSKSTQIAALLKNEGFLVSNEIDANRSQILLSNIERLGITNCLILNSSPDTIQSAFEGFFDKVLVDAPCSGEGMFKKESEALRAWSKEHVKSCAIRQSKILENAYYCLKKEGILVYSTCTYSKEENEYTIEQFIHNHPSMVIEDITVSWGREGFATSVETNKARRIFPMDNGEGHFVCKMRKTESTPCSKIKELKGENLPKCVTTFFHDYLAKSLPYVYMFNNKVYGGYYPFIHPGKNRIVRHQILLGEVVKDRFEPHQHLFIANTSLFAHIVELEYENAIKFIAGDILPIKCNKGYVQVNYNGFPIGFGKSDGTTIKNKYPKGLRKK